MGQCGLSEEHVLAGITSAAYACDWQLREADPDPSHATAHAKAAGGETGIFPALPGVAGHQATVMGDVFAGGAAIPRLQQQQQQQLEAAEEGAAAGLGRIGLASLQTLARLEIGPMFAGPPGLRDGGGSRTVARALLRSDISLETIL